MNTYDPICIYYITPKMCASFIIYEHTMFTLKFLKYTRSNK